jgi:hypothetical protein
MGKVTLLCVKDEKNYYWLRIIEPTFKKAFSVLRLCSATKKISKNRKCIIKLKDYFDVVKLLKEFSLEQMLSYYKLKYPSCSEFMVLKSMLYFDDAENDPDQFWINHLKWDEVKKKLVRW